MRFDRHRAFLVSQTPGNNTGYERAVAAFIDQGMLDPASEIPVAQRRCQSQVVVVTKVGMTAVNTAIQHGPYDATSGGPEPAASDIRLDRGCRAKHTA